MTATVRPIVDELECEPARKLVSLALDGEAGPAEVLVAQAHLERCERCREFASHVAAVTRALRLGLVRPDEVEETNRVKGERHETCT